jgi:predicted RNA-binding protein with RPS1 domain
MSKLEKNTNVVTQRGDKVYCQEDYAQELYNLFTNSSYSYPKNGKDIQKGQIMEITNIVDIHKDEVRFEVNNFNIIPINLNKEREFLSYYGLNKNSFLSWVNTAKGRDEFLDFKHSILVEDDRPVVKGSLNGAFKYTIKKEFMGQIKNPTIAYTAKIIDKNRGGFITEIFGIRTFLPGALAAANKLTDFESLVGTDINVMIEDYMSEIDTFIVSYKKYVSFILPQKIKEIDNEILHTGVVTGSIRNGVFIEFDNMFTGMLHVNKMSPELSERHRNRKIANGEQIECWVRGAGNDNKLILTCFKPGTAEDALKVGDTYTGKILTTKAFGTIVKLQTGEVGVIPTKYKIDIKYGKINVTVTAIENEKIYFIPAV